MGTCDDSPPKKADYRPRSEGVASLVRVSSVAGPRKVSGPGTAEGGREEKTSRVPGKSEATEKGIYYTSLRESTLHNNPPEFSYSDERSTLRRMFAF